MVSVKPALCSVLSGDDFCCKRSRVYEFCDDFFFKPADDMVTISKCKLEECEGRENYYKGNFFVDKYGKTEVKDENQDEIYHIKDLSDKSKEELFEYIKIHNLSKTQVKALLTGNDNISAIEQMVDEYFAKEREEVEDSYLNIWVERQKSEKNRMKTLMALLDDINKIDAEMAARRCKINGDISDIYFKALFGERG